MIKERIFEKNGKVYEFISLVMVLIFSVLPIFASFGPEKYGKLFKVFSAIELCVLLFCIVVAALLFLLQTAKSSFGLKLSKLAQKIKESIKARPYILLLVFSLVIASVCTYRAPDRARALAGTDFRPDGFLMYTSFASLFVFASSIKNKTYKKVIFGVYVASFLWVSLIMLQQYYGLIGSTPKADTPLWAKGIEEFNIRVGIRNGHFYKGLTGSFYNSNHMGYYLCLCSALFTGMLLKSDRLITGVLTAVLCAFSYWMIICNDTFGGFVSIFLIILICAIYLILTKKLPLVKASLPLLIFLAMCICFSLTQKEDGQSSIVTNITQLKTDVKSIVTSDDEQENKAGSGRWKLWVNTSKMISGKPLLGYGPDNLKPPSKAYNMSMDRAHNEFLEISAACGIPCALFYCFAVAFSFFHTLRRKNLMEKGSLGLMPAMAVGAYFISSLVGVFLFYTGCHLFIVLGLMNE